MGPCGAAEWRLNAGRRRQAPGGDPLGLTRNQTYPHLQASAQAILDCRGVDLAGLLKPCLGGLERDEAELRWRTFVSGRIHAAGGSGDEAPQGFNPTPAPASALTSTPVRSPGSRAAERARAMDLAEENAAWRDELQEVERQIEGRAPNGCRATLLLRECHEMSPRVAGIVNAAPEPG